MTQTIYGTFDPIRVDCRPGRKDGECVHPTYDVRETLILNEAEDLDTVAEHLGVKPEDMLDQIEVATSRGLARVSKGRLVPTSLGIWLDDLSYN